MFLLLIYLAIWEECRAAKRHSRSSERLGRRFLQRFPPKSGNLFSVICRVPLFHRNEFDFPREGNGWSFAHARRLWSLAENGYLRYELLGNFDKAMIALIRKYDVLEGGMPRCLRQHEDDQILAFEKKGCVFVFNFHPTRSQTGLFVPVPEKGDYQVILSTDDKTFGGYQNIDKSVVYHTWAHDPQMGDGFVIYLPARTAVVLRKIDK